MAQGPVLILSASVPAQHKLHTPGGEDIPHSHVSQCADIPYLLQHRCNGRRELERSSPQTLTLVCETLERHNHRAWDVFIASLAYILCWQICWRYIPVLIMWDDFVFIPSGCCQVWARSAVIFYSRVSVSGSPPQLSHYINHIVRQSSVNSSEILLETVKSKISFFFFFTVLDKKMPAKCLEFSCF